jgi:signal transduction histidine kinase/CheY-like chemotaxis protein
MNPDPTLVSALLEPRDRTQASVRLARALGAEHLVLLVVDSEVGALLPAVGFPQTLSGGREWRELAARCKSGEAEARLRYGAGADLLPALCLPLARGAIVMLLGGRPERAAVESVKPWLDLLAFGLTSERDALAGRGHAQASRDAARQAQALADSLAAAQGEVQLVVQQLQEASRLKDEFLATVSHELRTPLNAITGWSHILRRDENLDEDTRRRGLDAIARNASAQAQLISDLLDVSRIVAGKLRLDVRPVDVSAVIETALDTVRPAAEAKEIRLEAIADPEAGPVSGDPDRLQQVVWNLLSNAVRFAPKRGRVLVRLARLNSQVEITVEDDGPGIDADFLPYVFDRFRQGNAGVTRKHGGLGLGLAIVRHLVELHGGRVEARNRATGTGAIFTVALPLMSVGSKADLPTAEGTLWRDMPSLEGIRVLVVEDDVDSREMAVAVLTRAGATVSMAASAAEGLSLLERERPDVLVSDVEMPGESGLDLLQKVRALPEDRGGRTPAAALTAYASAADRMRALRAGFHMHLPKPVQPAELVTVVASLARRT